MLSKQPAGMFKKARCSDHMYRKLTWKKVYSRRNGGELCDMQRVRTWAIRPCAAGLHSAALASQAWPRSSRAPGWSALGARCLSPSDLRCRKGVCPRPAAPGWSSAMNQPRVALFNLAHQKSDSWCARTPADPTSLPAPSARARTHTLSAPCHHSCRCANPGIGIFLRRRFGKWQMRGWCVCSAVREDARRGCRCSPRDQAAFPLCAKAWLAGSQGRVLAVWWELSTIRPAWWWPACGRLLSCGGWSCYWSPVLWKKDNKKDMIAWGGGVSAW